MTRSRLLALAVLIGALAARGADAVCTKTLNGPTCTANALVTDPACCSAATCTIDGTVTVNAPTCDLDLGGRSLKITSTGILMVGAHTVTIEAGSVEIAGRIDASGHTSPAVGGVVTITATGPFSLTGGGGDGINVSGFGAGAGNIGVTAAGAITLGGGSILANGLDTNSTGGNIAFDSTGGGITVGIQVQANAVPGTSFGGTVILQAQGDLTLSGTARIQALGGSGGAGAITLTANGAVSIGTNVQLQANGQASSAGEGGSVDIEGASISVQGTIEVKGGSDSSFDVGGDGGTVSLEADTGSLVLMSTSQAITADGAGGGSGGQVDVTTDDAKNGPITIGAAMSAQGFGGALGRPSSGGEIDITSAHGLTVTRALNVTGAGDGGGTVDLEVARDVVIKSVIAASDPTIAGLFSVTSGHDVTLTGSGTSIKLNGVADHQNDPASGGEIAIVADNKVTVTAFILDASGAAAGFGGQISIDAGSDVAIDHASTLNASSGGVSGASGGSVTLTAGAGDLAGNLQIDGDLLANGQGGAAPSPTISLRGCRLTISDTAHVNSMGDPASANVFVGRTSITIHGKVVATSANTAMYPIGSPPTVSGANGSVQPPFGNCAGAGCAMPVCSPQNPPPGNPPCLTPCPTCGNNTKEFPETCDPPVCPGCDIHCRTRPSGCSVAFPCIDGQCDPVFGCLQEPVANGTGCQDGNACTSGDACHGGVCQAGAPTDCNDNNVCTQDACNPASGCTHTPVTCPDDGNACNGAETCTPPGGCHHGTLVTCPGGMVCVPSSGQCVTKPCSTASECDDGNPCTTDACSSGKCVSTPLANGPQPGCGDTNPCNGTETCQSGICTPGSPPTCDDGDPCTDDSCDPLVPGGCQHAAVAGCCHMPGDCPGANICTTCVSNTCGVLDNCCATNADCDDANPCTTDTCPANHQCQHANVANGPAPGCGDDPCVPGASCQAGSCVGGTPKNCDDNMLCTLDACDSGTGQCTHQPVQGCCQQSDSECNDNNPCTIDICDLPDAHVCHNTPRFADCRTCSVDTDCDPEGACGASVCGPDGFCVDHPQPNCDDGNCDTTDTCVVDGPMATHCEHRPGRCNDGDACNGVETCQAGFCRHGAPPSCDDGDPCTDDACSPASGCTHTPKTRFDSVRCRLDAMAAALQRAAGGSASVRARLSALVGTARQKVDKAAAAGSGKAALRSLKAVGKPLKIIGNTVRAALKHKKIGQPLADALLTGAQGAAQAVEQLKASVAP